MDFSRAHDRLISFAVSAMITTSFLATAPNPNAVTAAAGPQPAAVMNALEGLRAAGWAGMQNAALPSPAIAPQTSPSAPAAADAPPLSDIQIQKLLKLTVDHGHDTVIEPPLMDVFGIPSSGAGLPVRQVTIKVPPAFVRAFEQVSTDGGYVFFYGTSTDFAAYRTNAKLELVAAASKNANRAYAAIPLDEAQQQLKAEIAYWGNVADHF